MAVQGGGFLFELPILTFYPYFFLSCYVMGQKTQLPQLHIIKKTFLDKPVVDAPVEAEVEGAEVATFPHHLHHRLVVEL